MDENKNILNTNLISILQGIQDEYGYLPEEKLIEAAKKCDVPLVDVYSVATFYRSFSLKPRGRHLITACLGTACHVRGSPRIVEEFERKLGIKPGETTKDGKFSLETVMCLGCCAIGPIVVADGKYYGPVTLTKIDTILKKFR